MSDWRARPPLWLAAYTTALLIWLLGFYLPLFFATFPRTIDSLDFSYYYAAARIGLEHGWDRIYDLALQRQTFFQLHPSSDIFDWRRYFVSPPPVAWLVAVLTLLPLAVAFWTFAVLSAAAFASAGWVVAPGRGLGRVAFFATAACTYPVLIAIQTGQVTPIIATAAMLGWWLTRRGKPVAAGLVLVALVLKPQVAILVAPALLVAGERRVFVVWAAGAFAVAVVSAASLGGGGLDELRSVLSMEQGRTANLVWTLSGVFGAGLAATALEVAAAVVALGAAWRHRISLELVFVAGMLGTVLASPYHNPSDFAILAPAAWLYVRAGVPGWQLGWLALGMLATYAAASFGPLLLLVFTIVWLVLITVRRPPTPPAADAGFGRAVVAAGAPR